MAIEEAIPPRRRKRRSLRLKDYDYTQPGGYFVTICTQDRRCLWGDVRAGEMWLNEIGQIAEWCWEEVPSHFPHVRGDSFVVMPNHLHGILILRETRRGTTCRAPTPDTEEFARPVAGSLPTIIRSFKAAVTKHVRRATKIKDFQVWQRGYYERIVRNERELELLREYIVSNPIRWALDAENPAVIAGGKRGLHQGSGRQKHDPPE